MIREADAVNELRLRNLASTEHVAFHAGTRSSKAGYTPGISLSRLACYTAVS